MLFCQLAQLILSTFLTDKFTYYIQIVNAVTYIAIHPRRKKRYFLKILKLKQQNFQKKIEEMSGVYV